MFLGHPANSSGYPANLYKPNFYIKEYLTKNFTYYAQK
jgi:hypothetical protein